MSDPVSIPSLFDQIVDLWFHGLDTYDIHRETGVSEAICARVISDHREAQVRAGRTYRDTRDKVLLLAGSGVPASVISGRLTVPMFFVLWIIDQNRPRRSEAAE